MKSQAINPDTNGRVCAIKCPKDQVTAQQQSFAVARLSLRCIRLYCARLSSGGQRVVTEIVLVRHGQANSHATDEAGYDRLSDLGQTQAGWLGQWLGATDPHFDRVITGTLLRQRQTAEAMGHRNSQADTRLNELSFFALSQALEAQYGIPAPREATEFARYLPEVIAHWAGDRLTDVPESFAQFSDRIAALITEICAGHGRVLLVTSGGVIGMVIRQVLGLNDAGMAKVMLGTMNSSLHRLHYVQGGLMLGTFNATPHLDAPDRVHARTFI